MIADIRLTGGCEPSTAAGRCRHVHRPALVARWGGGNGGTNTPHREVSRGRQSAGRQSFHLLPLSDDAELPTGRALRPSLIALRRTFGRPMAVHPSHHAFRPQTRHRLGHHEADGGCEAIRTSQCGYRCRSRRPAPRADATGRVGHFVVKTCNAPHPICPPGFRRLLIDRDRASSCCRRETRAASSSTFAATR